MAVFTSPKEMCSHISMGIATDACLLSRGVGMLAPGDTHLPFLGLRSQAQP